MGETTASAIDRALLRKLRELPRHAYALAQEIAAEGGSDRATVYRRLKALERAGLLAARSQGGHGPERRVLRPTAVGEEALRAELRDAVRLLLEAFAARAPRGGGGGSSRPPIVFVSGSRISGIEQRIVRSLARQHPRRVHLVVPPGVDVPGAMESPWTALPFRDGYASTMFVNELPPARALPRAAAEWARVLAPAGVAYVIAPAPLPRGADPFIDFFADLQGEIFPDQAGTADVERVDATLRRSFARVRRARQAEQIVWTCIRPNP